MNALKTIILGTALALGLNMGASANELKLRSHVVVKGDVVTLGDLFENAGEKAGIAVFRAPAFGGHGTIQADRVASAATSNGLDWRAEGFMPPVQVSRASREITPHEIATAIEESLKARHGAAGFDVQLPPQMNSLHVEAEITSALKIREVSEMFGGRIRAIIEVEGSSVLGNGTTVEGVAYEMIPIVQTARGIQRGAIISSSDVVIRLVRKDRAGILPVSNLQDVVGKSARSNIAAERTVRLNDLEEPKLVFRNKGVIMVFNRPGLSLSVRGQAMQDGSEGDLIRVMNPSSNRILEGIVTRDGRVLIQSPLDLAQASRTQEAQ